MTKTHRTDVQASPARKMELIGARRVLLEKLRKFRPGLAWGLESLGRVEIGGRANDDQRDHSQRIVRLAFNAVDAWNIELNGHVLAHLAGERLGTFRCHTADAGGVVALVGGDEMNVVYGLDTNQLRLENERVAAP